MRKVISLCLALVVCLSLCACKNEAEETANAYEWKKLYGEVGYDSATYLQQEQEVFEFQSDGVGRSYKRSRYNIAGAEWKEYSRSSFTWEVKGDYIHIFHGTAESSYKIEIIGESMRRVSDGKMFSIHRKAE